MTWQELEALIEERLVYYNIEFEHEGTKRTYGHKSGKGKHDFKLRNCRINAIEAKNIGTLSNMRLPWPGRKQTAIHAHQLAALRKVGGGILIHENKGDRFFYVSMSDLDKIVIEHGMIPSLLDKYIGHLGIDLDTFIRNLPLEK